MKHYFILLLIMSALTTSCSASQRQDQTREQRIASSPQWKGEKFENIEPVVQPGFSEMVTMGWEFFTQKEKGGTTKEAMPAAPLKMEDWATTQDLQFAWLGHTTFLFKVEGKWIITDPIFSEKAGAFGFLSPTRYSNLPAGIDDLPTIDVVLITHNHYDHLDEASIRFLITADTHFIAPLAVGKKLEEWGVNPANLTELDWWQSKQIGPITVTSAPARHFSGRGLFDHNETLWTSYAIKGTNKNIFLSGDSGWHKELFEIGEKLGPFDLTFFEMGAYGKYRGWKEIHYTPEESVKAHQAVKGKVMVPSHWGTFDLAMFKWSEPIERYIKAANEAEIQYLTPKIGERIQLDGKSGNEKWWQEFMEPKTVEASK
ncbi:MAG: MBL fold metallo-hydrolase [SAR324 cluster bacterium]|nr:MBL fold metallo-hydrolase [SAR324 cluster bacterium]